jgi:neutral ceramidase
MPIKTRGDLIGWGQDRLHCSGINDPLMVSSLVIEESGVRIVIVTLDLLAVDFAEADAIRTKVAGVVGMDPKKVLVVASHTHSGPASIDICSMGKNEELSAEIVQSAQQCAHDATNSLATASVRTAFTTFVHNANRRKRNWIGRTVIGVNLKGPVDQQVSCASINSESAKILLVCYGCHPVINASSLQSADYVAGIRQTADSAGFTGVLFFPGALGDVNPYDRESQHSLVGAGIAQATEFGSQLAQNTLSALSTEIDDPTPQLACASTSLNVDLPRLKGGKIERQLLVQMLRISRLRTVAIPGEIFAQSSLLLRKKSEINGLAIVSCANGYIGYIPPQDEYARGGYEVRTVPSLLGYRVPAGTAEELQRISEDLIKNGIQAE